MTEQKISREDLVKLYDIELRFFDDLAESGLIQPIVENEVRYLLFDELPAFERFAEWHYTLDVNLPGLEIINDLLCKIRILQQENRRVHYIKFTETN